MTKPNIIFFLPLLILIPINAYSQVTFEGVEFTTNEANFTTTTQIRFESFDLSDDGFFTRFTDSDELRQYTFYRNVSSSAINLNWDAISSENLNFTISPTVADSSVNVTGTEVGQIKGDGLQKVRIFDGVVTHSFLNGDSFIEIIFEPLPVGPAGKYIWFNLNPANSTILGGVYAGQCPAGQFIIGVNTSGYIVCATP